MNFKQLLGIVWFGAYTILAIIWLLIGVVSWHNWLSLIFIFVIFLITYMMILEEAQQAKRYKWLCKFWCFDGNKRVRICTRSFPSLLEFLAKMLKNNPYYFVTIKKLIK